MEVIIAPKARGDIASILAWTDEDFGPQTLKRYGKLIATAMEQVAEDPERAGSRERPEIAENCRTNHLFFSRKAAGRSEDRIRQPRHFLLYRVTESNVVEIGRVLHDPMGFDAGDSNLYRYVNNAPTDASDSSGMELVAGSRATADYWKKTYSDYLGVKIAANQASSGVWVFDYYSKDRATIEGKINDANTTDFDKSNLQALLSNTEHRQIFDKGDRWSSEEVELTNSEKDLVNQVWGQTIYATTNSQMETEARRLANANGSGGPYVNGQYAGKVPESWNQPAPKAAPPTVPLSPPNASGEYVDGKYAGTVPENWNQPAIEAAPPPTELGPWRRYRSSSGPPPLSLTGNEKLDVVRELPPIDDSLKDAFGRPISGEQKIYRAFREAAPLIGSGLRKEFEAMFTPDNIAFMVGFTAFHTLLHATPLAPLAVAADIGMLAWIGIEGVVNGAALVGAMLDASASRTKEDFAYSVKNLADSATKLITTIAPALVGYGASKALRVATPTIRATSTRGRYTFRGREYSSFQAAAKAQTGVVAPASRNRWENEPAESK